MGPLGFTEILFVLLLALLLFGPRRLPSLGRTLGRGLAEFRRASTDLRRTIEDEVRDLERETKAAKFAVEASIAPLPPPEQSKAPEASIAPPPRSEQPKTPGTS